MKYLRYQYWQYLVPLYIGLGMTVLTPFIISSGMASAYWLVLSFFSFWILSVGNTVGMHRLFCHWSFKTTPAWEMVLLVIGTLSCYGSSFMWCLMHDQHHRHSDTEEDPHQLHSWKDVFRVSYHDTGHNRRMAIKLLKRPAHRFAHNYYWGLIGIFILILALISWKLLVFGYLVPLGLYILMGTAFNLYTHTPEGIKNSWFWALIFSGEGYHKNHHERPRDWRLADKWYQPDLGAWVISKIGTPHEHANS